MTKRTGSPRASHGSALTGHRLAIVDPETLRRCEPGRVGEIWVSGPSVAQGYWRRDEDSRRSFAGEMAEPADGERYLRTGDLGFLHAGELYICGRLKDLIILNGLNIYPQDVELAAFESHARLRENGTIAFAVDRDDTEQLVIVQELAFRQPVEPGMFECMASAVSMNVGVTPDVIVLVKAGPFRARPAARSAGSSAGRTSWRTACRRWPAGIARCWRPRRCRLRRGAGSGGGRARARRGVGRGGRSPAARRAGRAAGAGCRGDRSRTAVRVLRS